MVEAELNVGEPLKSEALDHLPLGAAFGHQLRIIETIDKHAAAHPEHVVSDGQWVFARVMSVLSGSYALYKVVPWLERLAKEHLFGQPLTLMTSAWRWLWMPLRRQA